MSAPQGEAPTLAVSSTLLEETCVDDERQIQPDGETEHLPARDSVAIVSTSDPMSDHPGVKGDSDHPAEVAQHAHEEENDHSLSDPHTGNHSRVSDCASLAICARGLARSYGLGKKKNFILTNINMTLPRGKIYGLLGASGCGKTTLLKCIVGQLYVHAGSLTVLGLPPLTPGHGIPGNLIGYMPQETALYPEFSVAETFSFFAKLNRMSQAQLAERTKFLLTLLGIAKHEHHLVGQLSGGEQRRVSLAVALLHNPKLLVLDEPTVGLDPVLRAKLWQYLRQLVAIDGVTILITTHYIEEARQSDLVGMMRGGMLLAEDSPDALLVKHHETSLEAVFLDLCKREPSSSPSPTDTSMVTVLPASQEPAALSTWHQDEEHNKPTQEQQHHRADPDHVKEDANDIALADWPPTPDQPSQLSNIRIDGPPLTSQTQTSCFARLRAKAVSEEKQLPSWTNIRALVFKNVTRLRRSYGFLAFMFLLPSVQIILFNLAIGMKPHNLGMGVVNYDAGYTFNASDPATALNMSSAWRASHAYAIQESPSGLTTLKLSLVFLQMIDSSVLNLKELASLDAGRSAIESGTNWGAYSISQNFTSDVLFRYEPGSTPQMVEGSSVSLLMDNTNMAVSAAIQTTSTAAYQLMLRDALPLKNLPSQLAQMPIKMLQPVYGDLDPIFTNFVAPGIMIAILYMLSIALTALAFVVDRKEGLLSRMWAAGVRPGDVILAHALTQVMVIIVQLSCLCIFSFLVFDVPIKGSPALVLWDMVLAGITGMSFGLLISTRVQTEGAAVQAALGSFFPVLLLSGVIWPLEGMPMWLQGISKIIPTTHGATTMRCLLLRGWDMYSDLVWPGYVAFICWTAFYLFVSTHLIKRTQ